MTGQSIEAPRESFLDAAERELIAFERREREFRMKEKEERADQLHMPGLTTELHS